MTATVSLIKAQSYAPDAVIAKLEAVLAPLGGMGALVKPGDRVLLKPNLLTGSRPKSECVTRPEIVYAVATLVKGAGGHPFLGDSPAFGSAYGVAKANGYLPWLERAQVTVKELHGQRYATTASGELAHLRLSQEAMNADVVINLPKVKSHVQLTLTLGVKNLFGCVPGKMKAWWHMEAGQDRDRFGTMLVETARAIAPQLTIIDGIVGHGGNGPSNGAPFARGLLGASSDVLALDRALVEILGAAPEDIPTVAQSMRLGYCPELAEITFPLEQPAALEIADWPLPSHLVPIDFGMPRVVRSTFKHLYIRFIKEPMTAYANR
ncbi:MAG: DUF362 domain-containing protein [Leptolyngbyaceae cyanobacterium]